MDLQKDKIVHRYSFNKSVICIDKIVNRYNTGVKITLQISDDVFVHRNYHAATNAKQEV